MNRINPYSTSFARWWCRSGRHTRPGRMITAATGRLSQAVRADTGGEIADGCVFHAPASSMAARRAAIDAILAGSGSEDGEIASR